MARVSRPRPQRRRDGARDVAGAFNIDVANQVAVCGACDSDVDNVPKGLLCSPASGVGWAPGKVGKLGIGAGSVIQSRNRTVGPTRLADTRRRLINEANPNQAQGRRQLAISSRMVAAATGGPR